MWSRVADARHDNVPLVVVLLDNPVRSYAWGSPSVLPELLGRKPTGEPQAELWAGAHPGSPSVVVDDGRTLDAYIGADVDGALGPDVMQRFGPRLPFLLKILAIERPLSIQVHPTKAQAEDGFAAENAAGVPLDTAHRKYRDANHKPEMVVALTDFSACVGFRQPTATVKLLLALGDDELDDAAETIVRPGGLESLVRTWLTLPDADAKRLADLIGTSDDMRDIAAHYPGDRGLLIAFLLNRVVLRPGEAVFVGPGVPHAYVSGVAVEPQASSDNTLRAGLTSKHVDVAEVMRLLRYEPDGGVTVVGQNAGLGTAVYQAPGVDEFRLSRFDSAGGDAPIGSGPAIVLAVGGDAEVSAGGHRVRMTPGAGAFLPWRDGRGQIRTEGVAFAVSVGSAAAG